MPFERPSLGKLIARAQADMSGRLPGTDPLLRRNLVAIIARMSAGTAHGLYGYLDWLALQLMPDTAETEHLERGLHLGHHAQARRPGCRNNILYRYGGGCPSRRDHLTAFRCRALCDDG